MLRKHFNNRKKYNLNKNNNSDNNQAKNNVINNLQDNLNNENKNIILNNEDKDAKERSIELLNSILKCANDKILLLKEEVCVAIKTLIPDILFSSSPENLNPPDIMTIIMKYPEALKFIQNEDYKFLKDYHNIIKVYNNFIAETQKILNEISLSFTKDTLVKAYIHSDNFPKDDLLNNYKTYITNLLEEIPKEGENISLNEEIKVNDEFLESSEAKESNLSSTEEIEMNPMFFYTSKLILEAATYEISKNLQDNEDKLSGEDKDNNENLLENEANNLEKSSNQTIQSHDNLIQYIKNTFNYIFELYSKKDEAKQLNEDEKFSNEIDNQIEDNQVDPQDKDEVVNTPFINSLEISCLIKSFVCITGETPVEEGFEFIPK